MMIKIIRKTLTLAQFYFHFIIGKIFGVSYVIKYLRNPDPLISVKLLKTFGATIGEKTTIKRSIYLDNVYEDENSVEDFSNLIIGDNCYIGDCVYFDLSDAVRIENNVVISAHASFVTHSDCNRSPYLKNIYPRQTSKITVGEGSWVAIGSIVLSGSTVSSNSVLAANSLLRGKTDEFSLYGGIPAVKLKDLRSDGKYI